jgi:hypothetical protein
MVMLVGKNLRKKEGIDALGFSADVLDALFVFNVGPVDSIGSELNMLSFGFVGPEFGPLEFEPESVPPVLFEENFMFF